MAALILVLTIDLEYVPARRGLEIIKEHGLTTLWAALAEDPSG